MKKEKFYLDIHDDASVWRHVAGSAGKRSVKVKDCRTYTEAMAYMDRENERDRTEVQP